MSITSEFIKKYHRIGDVMPDDLLQKAAKEIEQLEKAYELLFKENSDNCKRIAELEAEVGRLKALINNLGHGAGCRKNAFKECSCGLDEAMKGGEFCSYPDCNCPFDAPADPNWCARGYPHKPKGGA